MSRSSNQVIRLAMRSDDIPEEIEDREAALVLWPLLQSGSPRNLLVGRLVVGLGIDSMTAAARLDRLTLACAKECNAENGSEVARARRS